ncbi:MAG: hypothetical protein V4471_03485 [Pseudomonadota bacterium]
MRTMSLSELNKIIEYNEEARRDYTAYNIKQKIEEIITNESFKADEIKDKLDLLPDIRDIRVLKENVALIYKNGCLTRKNLELIASEKYFNSAKYLNIILNAFEKMGEINELNLEWIFTEKTLNALVLKVDLLERFNALTYDNLKIIRPYPRKTVGDCLLLSESDFFIDSACVELYSKLNLNSEHSINMTESKHGINSSLINAPSVNVSTNVVAPPIIFNGLTDFLVSATYLLSHIFNKNISIPFRATEQDTFKTKIEELEHLIKTAIEECREKYDVEEVKSPVKNNIVSQFFSTKSANDSMEVPLLEQRLLR